VASALNFEDSSSSYRVTGSFTYIANLSLQPWAIYTPTILNDSLRRHHRKLMVIAYGHAPISRRGNDSAPSANYIPAQLWKFFAARGNKLNIRHCWIVGNVRVDVSRLRHLVRLASLRSYLTWRKADFGRNMKPLQHLTRQRELSTLIMIMLTIICLRPFITPYLCLVRLEIAQ
jgi:hypothetical protein